jgi:signal transduction histidine kinase
MTTSRGLQKFATHEGVVTIPWHVVLSLVGATVQLVFAVLFWGLSREQSARPLQWLAAAALSGCLYGVCNTATTWTLDESVRSVMLRFGLEAGTLHSVSWLLFMVADEKRSLTRFEKAVLGCGAFMVLLTPWPGVVSQLELKVRYLDWLSREYHDINPTTFGSVCFATFVASLVYQLGKNVAAALEGKLNAKFRAAVSALLLVCAVNDVFASLDLIQMPLALELGFFIAVAVSGVLLVRNFVENANALQLSNALLAEAQNTLIQKERLAALGQFSTVIAHEVRNPLGVFFNATSQLKKIVVGESAHRLVQVMREESERLGRLVSDLLVFARPRDAMIEKVTASTFVQSAVDAATASAQVSMKVDIVNTLPSDALWCDPNMLRQSLVNLLRNAFEVTRQTRPIQVVLTQEPQAVVLSVIDDGPGVAAGAREDIFSPFFTTRAQGTGLGLAVVAQAARAHRGSVRVVDASQGGAHFELRIPMQSGALPSE